MPPNQPPPLPLAADRAALSNRLSMLISNRSSLLKSLNTSSSTSEKPTRRHAPPADEEDLWTGTQLNEGVGHVAQKPTADKKKADQMLRGKLLGKRKVGRVGRSSLAESESDEEEGRGSLGKRKRPRRVESAEYKEREVAGFDQDIREEQQVQDVQDAAGEMETGSVEEEAQEGVAQVQAGTGKKKKNKKRKKNKGKGNGE